MHEYTRTLNEYAHGVASAVLFLAIGANVSVQAQQTLTIAPFAGGVAPVNVYSATNYSGIHSSGFTVRTELGLDRVDFQVTNVPPGVTVSIANPSYVPSSTNAVNVSSSMGVAVTNVAEGEYTLYLVASSTNTSITPAIRSFFLSVGNRAIWNGVDTANVAWSVTTNWGGAPLVPGANVVFEDQAVNVGTNSVTANTTIGRLSYLRAQNNTSWRTALSSGVTLTVTNGFSANSISADNNGGGTSHNYGLDIRGTGGATLLVTNLSKNFALNQHNSAAASTTFLFNFASLPNLRAYVNRFGLNNMELIDEGTIGSQNSRCDLAANTFVVASFVGDYTQEHFTNAVTIWHHGDQSAYQNGQPMFATLGSSSTFWADSFVVGGSRVQSAQNTLSARSASSSAQFRNSDGISRMTMFGVAVDSGDNTISSGSRAVFNFAGSSLDILANELWLGRCRPRQGPGVNAHIHGTLYFGSGSVVDVNRAVLGYQAYTNDNDCRGIVTNLNGTFVVNDELVLGYTCGDYLTNGSFAFESFGRLTVSGAGGRARINAVSVGGPANVSVNNDINIISGAGLFLTNTIATPGAKLNLLNVNGSFLTLHVNGLDTRIHTKTIATSGSCPINFAAITNVGPFPAQIPLISYESASGSGFSLGTMPAATPAYGGYLTNDTSAKIIYLVLTNGPAQPGPVTWTADASDEWDTTTTNWVSGNTPYTYADGVPVRFDDSGESGSVNLTAARAPSITTINNSTLAYTFTGSGKLSGSGSLVKLGSGDFTIANSGSNDFSGGIIIGGGTMQVGNGGTTGNLGGGNITNNAVLIFNRSDSLTAANTISGAGSLTQEGAGATALGGANTYTGNTIVNAGTLALVGSASISDSANVTISSGATLDVTGRTNGTLTLTSGQTLKGNGTVQGDLTAAFDSGVSPGQSVGALNVSGDIILEGTITIEIDKAGGTNDVLSGDSIAYGGTLSLVNLNTPVSQNDGFKLFDATSYSGAFASIVPSTPGFGLVWDTSDLTSSGTIKAASDAPPGLLTWTGAENGNWDTTTTNWLDFDSSAPAMYTDGLPVRFDDTGLAGGVNLTTAVSPSVTIVNNDTDAYTFTGSGILGGSGSLVKLGPGSLTIANSGSNNFSGGVAMGGGTVQVGNGGTAGNLGGGNITNNASLIFNRSDSLTVANTISGTGSLTQEGAGTTSLGGTNTYTGDTTVSNGTLALVGGASISSSANISIDSGAVLNVTGRTDGTLTLASGQTIQGGGTVQGDLTAATNSTVSPGQSVGLLTVSGDIVLDGTTTIEIHKAGNTNDLLRSAGYISYGGTLAVSNLSDAFVVGDSFKIFDATTFSNVFTKIVPKRPAIGMAWDTSELTEAGILRVAVAPEPLPTTEIKVDFSIPGRPEAIDPDFSSWVVNSAPSISSTFSGVTITFTKVGPFGTGLAADWWKEGVDLGAKMADDGITVANGNGGGQIEMRISGLSEGPHTIATYHNTWQNPATHTFSPLNIWVNGVLTITNFVPSNRVTNNYDATAAFIEVFAEEDEDIVILYQADTNNAATDKNVCIDGIEIDSVNSTLKASKPYPEHRDEHVDGDTKSVLMTWHAAASAVSHDVYFGTDSNAVFSATTASPQFMGNQAATNFLATNLSSLATYYWRIDEVDSTNGVARGDLWFYRTRHLAFPGAEGYGRFARGGRGGRVIYVTNLNDSGPGSLRDAVMQTGPRTVVFSVSGIITLESGVAINDDYLTIAGQTAPGKGIMIRKWNFGFSGVNDLIVRHIRVFPGRLAGVTLDGMGMGGCDHAIMDHCSAGWALDEVMSTRTARNITIQNVMISEAMNVAGHKNYPPGTAHGYASTTSGLIGSWHHNLLAHCHGRNWSLGGGLDAAGRHTGHLDIRCNVVYNWRSRTTDGGAALVNFVNNYYKPGAATTLFTYLNPQQDNVEAFGPQLYYPSGNVMPGYPNAGNNLIGQPYVTNSPFFPSYVTTQSATNAYKIVLSDSGCTQPVQDGHDARIILETRTGTYTYSGSVSGYPGLPDHHDDVGGWESYPEVFRPADFDTDLDGLPNWWEILRGLNTNSAPGDFSDSNAALEDDDEYTELDRYVNWMAVPHYDCNKNGSVDVDLSQYTRGFTAGPVHSVSSPTNGTVVVLGDGKTARFTPTTGFAGLAEFRFGVSDAVGDSMTNKLVNVRVVEPTGSNTPPVLDPVTDRVVNVGVNVVFTNTVTDFDVPAQTLTFSLLTGPTNAALGTNSGIFTFRPLVTQANTTNLITIAVTDDGIPAMGDTQSFNVAVNPLTQPIVTSPARIGGQFGATVNGQTGPDYGVQASTNLLNWNTIIITNSPVMPFTWTDTNTSLYQKRFFRIKVGPPLP